MSTASEPRRAPDLSETRAGHTPGPWVDTGRYGEWPTGAYRAIRARFADEDGNLHDRHVATVEEGHHTPEARELARSTAQLIAASPRVTRALHGVLSELSRGGMGDRQGPLTDAVQEARAAIVQAGYPDPYADASPSRPSPPVPSPGPEDAKGGA